MVVIKNREEIEIMRENADLVSKTLAEVGKHIKPGVKLIELDRIAEEYIRDNGAVPGFKGYNGYPNTLCLSKNEVVVHGIPTNGECLEDGDILSVDCGTIKHGYYGDSAYTFAVGQVKDEVLLLMKRTKEALFKAIEIAVPGKRIGDLGNAIQSYVEQFGYAVVRDLVGHGIGKQMHESPEIPNYGRRGTGASLRKGMVICVEPMINLGTKKVLQDRDGWTIRTADKLPSAHYELTIAITENQPDVLSTFKYIEEVLNN